MPLLSTLKYSTAKSAAGAGGVQLILSAARSSVEEGDEVTFLLSGADPGIDVPYTITGITADDLFSGSLTGNFATDAEGGSQLTFILSQTDGDVGTETMTLTLDGTDVFFNVNIADTTPAATGEVQYTVPGTYSWTCPAGVTSVSAVAVGGGGGSINGGTSYTSPYYYQNWDLTGGGGGGLGYRNNIVVTPGQVYTVVVGKGGYSTNNTQGTGGTSYFQGYSIVSGSGGGSGSGLNTPYGAQYNGTHSFGGGYGGGYQGQGGGNGGAGGAFVGISKRTHATGGGGAGGYGSSGGPGGTNSGTGGNSTYGGGGGTGVVVTNRTSYSPGTSNAGHGGGVGIFGRSPLEGVSGPSGSYFTPDDITYEAPKITGEIYRYGSGRGGVLGNGTSNTYQLAASGAVRIMWGTGRSFPDNAGYVEPPSGGVTAAITQSLDNPNYYGSRVGDLFGYSVAISGNYAIVGAEREDDASANSLGIAYIIDVSTGAVVHTLINPNPDGVSLNDFFGSSVAISGNYAIVGSPREDDTSPLRADSGKAYIFNVTTGELVHTLNNPSTNTSTQDYFGYSVAISGNYAIVGAQQEDDVVGGLQSGKAYIFNVTTGALLHALDNPNVHNASVGNDRFGYSVAISGNYAIVGAVYEDDASATSNSGKAYIFNVSTGAVVHILDNPNALGATTNDSFGWSVAISGNYAIASSRTDGDLPASVGTAYIFNVTTGALLHTLDNPRPTASDLFGHSVAISGDYVTVGATQEDNNGDNNSGKAYIFNVTTGALIATLATPVIGNYASAKYGHSVGMSGNYVIVGAPYDTSTGGDIESGSSFIYKITQT